jgi:sigma-E factor negative regulatory protein RseA
MDGEVDEVEAGEVLGAIKTDTALRDEWASFHLIGAAMRRECGLNVDISASVMRALEAEPTVLAPVSLPENASESNAWRGRGGPMRPLLALAASAAGVAVVAWVALGTPGDQGASGLQSAPGAGSSLAVAAINKSQIEAPERHKELRDYLVAHHAHAPMVTMAEGTRYVRTVSLERGKP